MLDKEILMLKEQLDKLDNKDFDLDAWKIYTINILERIFGIDSHKIKQLNDLKYDFSSWSLRDTSGSAGSIKKKARVILESSINELENFGLPQSHKTKADSSNLLDILENELKGFQFKKLSEILEAEQNEEKQLKIASFFAEFTEKEKEDLLVKILCNV